MKSGVFLYFALFMAESNGEHIKRFLNCMATPKQPLSCSDSPHLVLAVFVNYHISTYILMRIAGAILGNIALESLHSLMIASTSLSLLFWAEIFAITIVIHPATTESAVSVLISWSWRSRNTGLASVFMGGGFSA